MKSLGGGVAHEMRNPLNAINLLANRIGGILQKTNNKPEKKDFREIDKTVKTILNCTSRANDVINIILSNLREEKDNNNLEYISVNDIVTQSIKEYGYNNEEERKKVILNLGENFIIKAEKTAFIYMIFNLVKNALYYIDSYPKSTVTISTIKDSNSDYNQIVVRDTGPGIPQEVIKQIFGSFYTSGKSGGTGLGLDFCQRSMEEFDGKIECISEVGEYTEFILSFPKINEEEKISDNTDYLQILVVDDQETISKIIGKSINNHIDGALVQTASNGSEAIDKLKNGNYNLILMDIEMPIMGGIEATKEIRKFDTEIPVIGYTSVAKKRDEAISSGMTDYLLKSTNHLSLIRNICKWNLVKYIPEYNKSNSNKKKRVLLADDEMINRMILKKSLEDRGFEIEDVQNGEELLNKYLEQINSNNKFDAIITDIHMPLIDGYGATEKIIKYNKENNIDIIPPIIAYSGDDEKKDIYGYFNAGMSDYFTKGDDVNYLADMIEFWTSEEISKS